MAKGILNLPAKKGLIFPDEKRKWILLVVIILVIGAVFFLIFGKSIFGSKEVYQLYLTESGDSWMGVLNVPGDIILKNKDYTFFVNTLILNNPADISGTYYNLEFTSPVNTCSVTFSTAKGSDSSSISTTVSDCIFNGQNGKYYFNATKIHPIGQSQSKVKSVSVSIRELG